MSVIDNIPIPFTLRVELVNDSLNTIDPSALPKAGVKEFPSQYPYLQSFASGLTSDKTKLVLLSGRTSGIHPLPKELTPQPQDSDYFSVPYQNYYIYVVDLEKNISYAVLLPAQYQPSLSIQNQQSIQVADDIYIVGGYGYNPSFGDQGTYPHVTRVKSISKLAETIIANINGPDNCFLLPFIQQTIDYRLMVTGGELIKLPPYNDGNFYLAYGQTFWGSYNNKDAKSVADFGTYTKSIKKFKILTYPDFATDINLDDIDYRQAKFEGASFQMNRRDLNVIPFIIPPNPTAPNAAAQQPSHTNVKSSSPHSHPAPHVRAPAGAIGYHHSKPSKRFTVLNTTSTPQYGILAYSGVFTPDGSNYPYLQPLLFNVSQYDHPEKTSNSDFSVLSFLQMHNNYACANIPISNGNYHYTIFWGGLSMVQTSSTGESYTIDSLFKIPLTTDVSVIAHDLTFRDKPIPSPLIQQTLIQPAGITSATKGLTSFGTEARFIRTYNESSDPEAINNENLLPINFADIPDNQEIQLGYIYGGIDSRDSTFATTTASSRVYKIFLTKTEAAPPLVHS